MFKTSKTAQFMILVGTLTAVFALPSFAEDPAYYDDVSRSIDTVVRPVVGTNSFQMQDIFNQQFVTREMSQLSPQVPSLGDLDKHSNVLFFDAQIGKFVAGRPSMFFQNGMTVFPELVNVQDGATESQEKVYQIVDQSKLIREVSHSPDGVKKGDVLCEKGSLTSKATIENVYQNGKVQIRHGFLHHLDILDLSDLTSCTPASSVSQNTEKAQTIGYASALTAVSVYPAQ